MEHGIPQTCEPLFQACVLVGVFRHQGLNLEIPPVMKKLPVKETHCNMQFCLPTKQNGILCGKEKTQTTTHQHAPLFDIQPLRVLSEHVQMGRCTLYYLLPQNYLHMHKALGYVTLILGAFLGVFRDR